MHGAFTLICWKHLNMTKKYQIFEIKIIVLTVETTKEKMSRSHYVTALNFYSKNRKKCFLNKSESSYLPGACVVLRVWVVK